PNTIRLYDFGEAENGLIYVVMEMLDGADLKDVLASEGTISVGRAVDLTLQVLDGLGEAHEQDFVHRDLKPSNLFLCTDRRGGDQIKILDFGIAKSLEETASEITKTGSICGTAAYVAPEYLHDPKPQKSADVYAVGLILLEMITGKRAFHGTTTAQTLMMQLQREIQVPRALAHTALAEIILRATRKEPARRYADADEMYQALEAVADQVPAELRLDPRQVGEVLRPLSDASMNAPMPAGQPRRDDSSSTLPRPDSTPPSGDLSPSSDALAEGHLPEMPPDTGLHDQKTMVTPLPSAFDSNQEVPAPPSPTKRRSQHADTPLGKRLAMVAIALLLAGGGSLAAWSLLGSKGKAGTSQPDNAPAAPIEAQEHGVEQKDSPREADRAGVVGDESAQDRPAEDESAEDVAAKSKDPAQDEEKADRPAETPGRGDAEETGDDLADGQVGQEEAAGEEAAKEQTAREEETALKEAAKREAAKREAARKEAAKREAAKTEAARKETRTPPEKSQPPREKPSSDDGEENVDEFLDEYL
ncbi:MAG: protein kinase domain-containing protein, partial [Persicimonas sp.]